MATQNYSVPQGRLFVAPRSTSAVNGALVEVGDADNIQIAFNQTFLDIFESQTGNRSNAVHAVTQTDGSVTFDILAFTAANLVKAFYGSSSAVTAGAVVDQAFNAYVGGSIHIPAASTAVVVKKGVTTLVLDTDYSYNAAHGRITFIGGSNITAVDGSAGDAVTVSYTKVAGTKIEALVAGLKDYKFVFEEINFDGTVKRHELHRVALDMTKTISLVSTNVNKLTLTGKLLPAPEIATAGLSQYYTVTL